MIELILNGRPTKLAEQTTVGELLAEKQVRPEVVSVELNGRMLERKEFETTRLRPGDQVEVLFFMGGGV